MGSIFKSNVAEDDEIYSLFTFSHFVEIKIRLFLPVINTVNWVLNVNIFYHKDGNGFL